MILKQKRVFLVIFKYLALLLAVLPFLVSFNELLTRIVEQNVLYIWIQENVVSVEAKMMGVLLKSFGYDFNYFPLVSMISVNGVSLGITWNCLGWQSFLLFFVSFLVGFRGRYSKLSIFEALIIGILGTFWLNILRMIFTILLAVHLPAIFRIVFHDYLAAATTVVWLFIFWWFVYSYILVEKEDVKIKNIIKV